MKKLHKFLIALFACSFAFTSMIGMSSCSLLDEVGADLESSSSIDDSESSGGSSGGSNNGSNSGSNSGSQGGSNGGSSSGNNSGSSGDTSGDVENCKHVWKEDVVAATCETAGLRTKYCSKCKFEKESEVLEKFGHDWAWGTFAEVKDEEGNVITPAYTGDYCTVCEQKASQNLEYVLTNGVYYVKGVGNCRDRKIYIPSKVEENGTTYEVAGVMGASGKFYGAFNDFSGITRLEVIGELEEIGKGAFSGCYNLEEVVFNKTVKKIAENTFVACDALANVEVAEGLEEVGALAFKDCVSLKEIVLPGSMATLGTEAFSNCTVLEKVVIGSVLSADSNVTTALTSISNYAFAECVSLKELVLGEGVIEIGRYAFSECENLGEIIIPDSVKEVGEYAFSNCEKAKVISIGRLMDNSKMETIWESAFSNCSSARVIKLPTSLKLVDYGVFSGATEVEEVHIADLNAWCNISFNQAACNPLSSGKAKLYVNGEEVVDLVITNDITNIAAYTFYNYKNMKSLVIGENVKYIGKNAFANCENVTNIQFNATNCTSLSLTLEAFSGIGAKVKPGVELVFGAGVTKVPNYLFAHNFEEDNFVRAKIATVSFEEGSVCKEIGKYAFRNCNAITEVTLPENVEKIDEGAFMYCTMLQKAILGESVKTIGANAFNDCRELEHVEIPETIASIGEDAFAECYLIETVVYPVFAVDYISMNSLKDVTVTTGEITESMFNSSSIETLRLGAGVTKVDRLAFAYSDIKLLDLTDATADIGLEAFSGCAQLEKVIIGNGIETIGEYAFYSCGNLKEVIIGEGVKKIEAGAFEDTALESVDFLDRTGWTVRNEDGIEELPSTTLSEFHKAANWLCDTYVEYVWEKND